MKRLNLDRAAPAVKRFVGKLILDPEGVELELAGQVLCKVIPRLQFSDAEKAAMIRLRQESMRCARERNKGVPAKVLAREIREAVKAVNNKRR